MSSNPAISQTEEPDTSYLFQIHRQTMQLCDHFEAFSYQVERQFDAVFTEFRKFDERLCGLEGRMEKLECRMDSIERKVDSLEGRMGSLDGRMDSLECKVDQLDGHMGRLESDNAEIKSTLQQILEKLS